MTDLSFDCPRCGESVNTRYYGPCETCAVQLRERFQAEAKDVAAPEYVPKMNVTPNAIATKE